MREHGGAIVEEGAGRNEESSGSIWQPTGKHLCGKHLFGGLEAEEASGRHLEVRSQKSTTRNRGREINDEE